MEATQQTTVEVADVSTGKDDNKKKKGFEEGDRMKEYENITERQLNPCQPYIIRLDGHLFSNFTKAFQKPYDERIFHAMLNTTIDLIGEFNAVAGYTQSDEISLIFPALKKKSPQDDNKQLKYEGRCQKLATLAAGFCSVRFLYHIKYQLKHNTSLSSQTYADLKYKLYSTCFDARAFNCPSDEEIVNNLIWRMKDVMRNSKNNLGFSHFHHKELVKMSPKQVLIKLKQEKGIDWWDMPDPYKFGCFVKRDRFTGQVVDSNGASRNQTKTRWLYGSFKVSKCEKGHITMLMDKFLNNCQPELKDRFQPVPEFQDPRKIAAANKKEKIADQ